MLHDWDFYSGMFAFYWDLLCRLPGAFVASLLAWESLIAVVITLLIVLGLRGLAGRFEAGAKKRHWILSFLAILTIWYACEENYETYAIERDAKESAQAQAETTRDLCKLLATRIHLGNRVREKYLKYEASGEEWFGVLSQEAVVTWAEWSRGTADALSFYYPDWDERFRGDLLEDWMQTKRDYVEKQIARLREFEKEVKCK